MTKPSARERIFAHVETWRPYTAFYPGLVGLAGAALAADDPQGWRLVGAWLAPTLGWIAGLYGGDFFDRELDAAAKPHRPIPSGRMRARTARDAMIAGILLGGAIGVALNPRVAVLVAVAAAVGIAYSRVFKARGLAGHIVRGVPTALAVVFGAMATSPIPPWWILPPALALLLHDAGTNLVGSLRDVAGDRAGGYGTYAVRHGTGAAVGVAGVLLVGWIAVAAAALLLVPAEDAARATGAVLLSVAAGVGTSVVVGLRRAGDPSPAVALRAHGVLVLERLVLAAAFIAAGGGAWLALAVLVPSLLLSAWAQARLRWRHELPPFSPPPASAVPTAAPSAPPVDVATVDAYVAAQLARLSEDPRGLPSLSSWDRRVRITLSDLDLVVELAVDDGVVRRVDPPTAPAARDVEVVTTADVFGEVFLTRATTPRRAYLAGRIRLRGRPRDLVALNQLFGELLRSTEVPGAAARVHAAPRGPGTASTTDSAAADPLVVISDTTLRDGEQMPGLAFSTADKRDIARALGELGVGLVEAGFPAVSTDEAAAVRAVVDLDLDAVVQVIARPVAADVDAAVATGAASIAVFVGTSDRHVRVKLRSDRTTVHDRVCVAVARARAAGRHVVFAAEDATRSELPWLVELCRAAVDAGADAIGLADTAGVATPWSMSALVAAVDDAVDVPVAVHCHDDLGLATANSLAAVRAGASGVQATMLGIGERAGNAALEQVAVAAEVVGGRRTGLDLAGLPAVATFVAMRAGMPVPPTRPVVGTNAFVHESGLHLDGIVADPLTYEPFSPALVGGQRRFVFGKHSGRRGLAAVLASHQVDLDERSFRELLAEVKIRGQHRHPLDEEALVELARTFRAAPVDSP